MKVEFSAFPKAFTGNVAVFVGADKQLQATAKAIDSATGGALRARDRGEPLHRRQEQDADGARPGGLSAG